MLCEYSLVGLSSISVVYQEGILTLFEHSPPSGHKLVLHDQIKEFRQLTHGFEKAVLDALSPPPDDR